MFEYPTTVFLYILICIKVVVNAVRLFVYFFRGITSMTAMENTKNICRINVNY